MSLNVEDLDIGLTDSPYIASPSLLEEAHHISHSHNSYLNSQDHYVKEQYGMQVAGWRWSDSVLFTQSSLNIALSDITALEGVYRVKGVFKLNDGMGLFVNAARGELKMEMSLWSENSRFEVIGSANEKWYEIVADLCLKFT